MNVVDVFNVTRTDAELKALSADTKFAILDAGHYTSANADALMGESASFLTKMRSTFFAYKDLVRDRLAGLESRDNVVL